MRQGVQGQPRPHGLVRLRRRAASGMRPPFRGASRCAAAPVGRDADAGHSGRRVEVGRDTGLPMPTPLSTPLPARREMRAHLWASSAIATLITLGGVQYGAATPLKAAGTLSPNPLHISQWIANKPHQSTLAIYTLRGLVGDVVAQRMEGRRSFDIRRTATYITWCDLVGELYTRPWVSILCPRWFPTLC